MEKSSLVLIAIILGFFVAIIKICFASKCTEIEIGCIKIKRDVAIEPTRYDENKPIII